MMINTIKYKLILFVIIFLGTYLFGEDFIEVYSPMNTPVQATYNYVEYPEEYISIAYEIIDDMFDYNFDVIALPSNNYNCYSYAMHVSEDGRDEFGEYGREVKFLRDAVDDVYLTDGSFIEQEDPYNGIGEWDGLQKIMCNNGIYDHACVYAYGEGILARVYSKCGNCHLVEHYLDDGPYWDNAYSIDYYRYGDPNDNDVNNIGNIAMFLGVNYPNPFNPETCISYNLSGNVVNPRIEIFNIKGELVRRFNLEDVEGKNSVVWNGTDSNGNDVGSGVYFYTLKNNGQIMETRKMTLLK